MQVGDQVGVTSYRYPNSMTRGPYTVTKINKVRVTIQHADGSERVFSVITDRELTVGYPCSSTLIISIDEFNKLVSDTETRLKRGAALAKLQQAVSEIKSGWDVNPIIVDTVRSLLQEYSECV